MARKQETPAPTANAKDPVSTTETSGSQPEGGAFPLSPIDAASPNPGEAGAPATAPGSGESADQALPAALADSGAGSDIASSDLSASDPPAAEAAASEGAGQNGPALTDNSGGEDESAEEDQSEANPNPATLQIYPMRSYMDEGELRRRGGSAYTVPRRHAEELVQRNLASFEPLKE
ncbi:hypothetical protein ACNFIC_02775 [Pseudomonas sp. NY15463]|uniref:hypothetical protein n=1 Tax=Pseudomonas sp. NY15463 TaxID=3400361 RepID=UPI003A8B246F